MISAETAIDSEADTLRWWGRLSKRDRLDVLAWIEDGGVPPGWKGTRLDYARTECPRGLITGRYGRIL